MQISTVSHPDATVIAVTGRIDQATADDFLATLQGRLDRADMARPAVIDFSGVAYVSSVGLRALMIMARQVKARQGRLGIAALQPLVREVFDIARFDLVIPCFDSIEGAITGMQP